MISHDICLGLTSFSVIISRFIHVAANGITSFCYGWVIFHCINTSVYHIFFIQSSVRRHLGYFHVLAIVNSAALNNGVHASFLVTVLCSYIHSVLAWRIPGKAEPGGLPSMGSHRVGHDWSDLAATTGLLNLTVIIFSFLRSLHTISIEAVSVYFPTNSVGEFPFFPF